MTNELKPNYVKFAREICQFAFEGCDADGFTIQEIGVKCGVLKVEGFDEEKHPNIVNAEDFEAGDDVYLFVEPIAVPDVSELVRYSSIKRYGSEEVIERNELGDYVRYDQAAEVIAELKRRNREIELEHTGVRNSYYDERRKVVALEAELAQIKAQDPVGYLVKHASGVTTYFDAETYNKHGFDIEIVRTLFAAPVDQTPEIERLRSAGFSLLAAFDEDNDLDNPEKFNAYHNLKSALSGKEMS